MLRSLFAGISGLRANQATLDVTGNNIANANTIGFKGSSTIFQDTLSQALTGGSRPSDSRGGGNPIQIGLGVQLAATSLNLLQGSAQNTGKLNDLAISGDGMFITEASNQRLYTRAGSFTFDDQGTLVTPSGARVQGFLVDANGDKTGDLVDLSLANANAVPAPAAGVKLKSYTIGQDGKITGIYDDGLKRILGQVAIADFNNAMGLEKVGETSFRETQASGSGQFGVAGEGRRGVLMTGTVEMSNVDLAAEFTNLILAQRGFQACSRVISTSDQVLEDLVNIKR